MKIEFEFLSALTEKLMVRTLIRKKMMLLMRSPEKDEVEQKPVHVGKAAVKLFFYAGLQVIHARYQRLDVEEEDAFPEFLPLKECIGSDCNADGLYVVEKSHFVCLLGINVPILPLVKVGFDGIGLRKIALRIELDEPIN